MVLQLHLERVLTQRLQVIELASQQLNEELKQVERQIKQAKQTQQRDKARAAQREQQQQFIAQRGRTAQVLWHLTQALPEDIYLETLSLRGEHISAIGHTTQQAQLTDLLDRLERTQRLNNVVLHSIVEQQSRQRFSLSLQYVNSGKGDDH
nr:PilN domain-containing protein [Vibrio sp. JPW-9-11-11]